MPFSMAATTPRVGIPYPSKPSYHTRKAQVIWLGQASTSSFARAAMSASERVCIPWGVRIV